MYLFHLQLKLCANRWHFRQDEEFGWRVTHKWKCCNPVAIVGAVAADCLIVAFVLHLHTIIMCHAPQRGDYYLSTGGPGRWMLEGIENWDWYLMINIDWPAPCRPNHIAHFGDKLVTFAIREWSWLAGWYANLDSDALISQSIFKCFRHTLLSTIWLCHRLCHLIIWNLDEWTKLL